jgi:hypothetical protein
MDAGSKAMTDYVWFDEPQPAGDLLDPDLAAAITPFNLVLGYTHFGDLFLRDPDTDEFAVLLQGTSTLFDTGYFEESEFRNEYLRNPDMIEHVIRPSHVEALERRLGQLDAGQVFIPVPIPAFGGSDELTTYDRGGVNEYLSFLFQSLGLARDLRSPGG